MITLEMIEEEGLYYEAVRRHAQDKHCDDTCDGEDPRFTCLITADADMIWCNETGLLAYATDSESDPVRVHVPVALRLALEERDVFQEELVEAERLEESNRIAAETYAAEIQTLRKALGMLVGAEDAAYLRVDCLAARVVDDVSELDNVLAMLLRFAPESGHSVYMARDLFRKRDDRKAGAR